MGSVMELVEGPTLASLFWPKSNVAPTLDIHVVLDNLSAHRAPPVQRWLLRHPRVHFHFTPTCASWLNLGGTLLRTSH
jgi:DDE superfamily endonuclease